MRKGRGRADEAARKREDDEGIKILHKMAEREMSRRFDENAAKQREDQLVLDQYYRDKEEDDRRAVVSSGGRGEWFPRPLSPPGEEVGVPRPRPIIVLTPEKEFVKKRSGRGRQATPKKSPASPRKETLRGPTRFGSASPDRPGGFDMAMMTQSTSRKVVVDKRGLHTRKKVLSAAKQAKWDARRLKDRRLWRQGAVGTARELPGAAMVAAAVGQPAHTIAAGHDLPVPPVTT
ncbi:MAG: hypothetical protein GY737_08240, partial [Desulfobacteraceae bacterium]|nr:hypothetical protein [Desulfobacteraceae bacterium]